MAFNPSGDPPAAARRLRDWLLERLADAPAVGRAADPRSSP
jgi:hypothetical protein